MCVIAIAVERMLTENELRACERSNPHGGGCSWVERGLVHFKKGLDANEIAELLKDKPLPHVVHFRIATVGGVRPSRCHPFTVKATDNDPLAGVSKSVLYHNGHASGWEFWATLAGVHPSPGLSDSQAIARIVSIRGDGVLKELVERGAGKFAVMKNDGRVTLFGRFESRAGATFSNLNWAHGLSCNPLHTHSHKAKSGHKSHGQYNLNGFEDDGNHSTQKSWWKREMDISE